MNLFSVQSLEYFNTFHRMVYNMPQNISQFLWIVWVHSTKSLSRLNVYRHSWKVWRHSPEFLRKFQVCLPTFLGMFRKSPQNVQHLPDYSTTFLRMFVDILQKTTLLLFPTFPAFRSHSLNPAFIHGLYLIKYFDFQAWRKIQPIRLWMFPKLGP